MRRRYVEPLANSICAGLPDTDIFHFGRACPVSVRNFTAGETLWAAGEILEYIVILVSGALVARAAASPDCSASVVAEYMPGHIVALEAAISKRMSIPESVEAVSDGSLLLIDAKGIDNLTPKLRTAFYKNISAYLADDLIRQRRRTSILMLRSTRARLLRYFDILRDRQGQDKVTVYKSQLDLADYLSVTRNSLDNIMKALVKEGMIRYLADPGAIRKKNIRTRIFQLNFAKGAHGEDTDAP